RFPPLYEPEYADGVDHRESESPPEIGPDQTQPGEMDEGAAEQRDEQAVAARGVESENAVARMAPRRGDFPDRHAAQHQEDGDEEGSRLPGPGHPGEVKHHTLPRAKPLAM